MTKLCRIGSSADQTKTKNEIIFSRKMVKVKLLLKGVKTKLS